VATGLEIITLCENTAGGGGTLGEHGLSLLIRYCGRQFLFDTGAGATLLHNAKVMDLDLGEVDAVLLSHGHYDHTGGLLDLVKAIGPVDVYGHPEIFGAKHSLREGKAKYTGIPASQAELVAAGARFHLHKDFMEVFPGVWLTGEIPRTTTFEEAEESFYLRTAEGFVPDPVLDDQSLVLNTSRGLVVVLGCAHAGVVNILRHITNMFPRRSIYAVLGGTHLRSSSQERINLTVEAFQKLDIQHVEVIHCTGFAASVAFAVAFGSRFSPGQVGQVFRLED
jgi:7,8-dihydropterin-6-yl-methyl-4-(beta-D-ribofuranosyl)aminobenzene 5'-phosphate synthase